MIFFLGLSIAKRMRLKLNIISAKTILREEALVNSPLYKSSGKLCRDSTGDLAGNSGTLPGIHKEISRTYWGFERDFLNN